MKSSCIRTRCGIKSNVVHSSSQNIRQGSLVSKDTLSLLVLALNEKSGSLVLASINEKSNSSGLPQMRSWVRLDIMITGLTSLIKRFLALINTSMSLLCEYIRENRGVSPLSVQQSKKKFFFYHYTNILIQ